MASLGAVGKCARILTVPGRCGTNICSAPGARAFPLAAVREGDRFSIVAITPNVSVTPAHDRMPLVLGPEESSVWLEPDFPTLGKQDGISLISRPEP